MDSQKNLKKIGFALVMLVAVTATRGLAQDRGAQLRRAVATGNLAAVRKQATSKDIVNSADSHGLTPLMIAAALGKADVIVLLLKAGANIDATTTDWKATALMFAANFGRMEAATALVDGDANIKTVDKEGYTCVDYCILPTTGQDREGAIAVGKYLNSKGAPPTKMKKEDALSRLLGVSDPDRLKELIDGVMK